MDVMLPGLVKYHPAGLALIHPSEVGKITPPEGWGNWEDAELVWSRAGVHA